MICLVIALLLQTERQYLKITDYTAYDFGDAPKVQLVDGFLTEGMNKAGSSCWGI